MSSAIGKVRKHVAAFHATHAALRMQRAAHEVHLPMCDGAHSSIHSLADLHPAHPEEKQLSHLVERAKQIHETHPPVQEHGFALAALSCISLGVLSVIPYNNVLKGDPGSPLFVTFVLHLVIIGSSLPQVGALIRERKIPLAYHLGVVLFGSLFVASKSDAYVRLPASVCLLLSNMRMLVGVAVQKFVFGKTYAVAQLVSVVIITAGLSWASAAMQGAKAQATSTGASGGDFALGVFEVFVSCLSLILMSSTVKVAFSQFGEHVKEQIFMQHLLQLPIIYPVQWHKVGPRITAWAAERDWWLIFNLLASVVATFAARSAATTMASRAPNLLTAQLVQTVEAFLQLLVVAFMRAPPFPPMGFWAGTAVLVLGTLEYLRASDHAPKAKEEPEEKKAK